MYAITKECAEADDTDIDGINLCGLDDVDFHSTGEVSHSKWVTLVFNTSSSF